MAELPFHIAYRENRRDHPELRKPSGGDQILYVESGIGRFCADGYVADVRPGTVIRARPGVRYNFSPSASQDLHVRVRIFH